MWTWIPVLLDFAALAGCAYLLYAAILVGRSLHRRPPRVSGTPSITILKPLHGAEPMLADNLRSFCRQAYRGPVEIIFGLDDAADPALAVARAIAAEERRDGLDIAIVVRPLGPGANPKIANLVNMAAAARNEVMVLADSDIRVGPDYLDTLVAGLESTGTGAVTCLYYGVPAGGLWSRMAAAAIDTHFLPSVVFGMAIGLAAPCFGSTIAIRRALLDQLGGFSRFADCLADDYALGAAVRAAGHRVAVAPRAVGHICAERNLTELVRHELRWARTVRSIDPAGFAGSVVTHPFALAVIGWLTGGGRVAVVLAALALCCRLVLWMRVNAAVGHAHGPYWLVPARELMSFCIYILAFLGRRVDWQGTRYEVDADGVLIPAKRSSP